MNRRVTFILGWLITSLWVIADFRPSTAEAQGSRYETGDVYRLAAGDSISRQLIIAAEWVEIAGYVNNDLFAAGNTVSVEGIIGDDAILTGKSVSLRGIVNDMFLSASDNLLIDGTVTGDLIATGNQLRFTENAIVSGRLFLAGNEINLDGASVTGPSRIAGSTVRLNGVFRDHVVIYSNDVFFGPDYRPSGDTKIISSKNLYRENMGQVPERLVLEVKQPSAFPVFMFQVWFYLSMLVTGVVLIYLFKPLTTDLHRFATERFWKNTGIGFLLVLLVPLLLFILLFPVITIPLAILICILFSISLYLSYLAVAMMLGLQFIQWFNKVHSRMTYYWSLALGLLIIAIINNLPFIGPLFSLLLLFFGLGSFWAYVVKRYPRPVASDV
jgi:hypothetical protein